MIVYSNLNKKFFLSAIAALLVISLLFMPMPTDNLWWREVFNSGHTVLFLVLSFVLFFRLQAVFHFSSAIIAYLTVAALMILLGMAIEMIQSMLQREASIDDLYRNFIGIISGLGFVSLTRQKNSRNKMLALMFSLAFLFLGTRSLFQISCHYMQRDKAFPMITEFDERWSSSFVRFNNAELLGLVDIERDKNIKFYRLRFDASQYPGVSVIEPEKNWSAYSKLHLSVYSDNTSDIKLVLRVHDHRHTQAYNDRFNKRYVIRPGLNEIEVNLSEVRKAPVGRELDLANIAGVGFFLVNVEKSLFLEVSNIFLAF